jgi:EAL domain-containing protein (putative c-di-GMP-specific phosphodiesterase class I)
LSKIVSSGSLTEAVPRFLGYIFASSDLVFEIHPADGALRNVMGAASLLTGRDPAALEAQPWTTLFSPQDRDMVQHMISAIRPGQRKGPLRVTLDNTRPGATPLPLGLQIFQADKDMAISVSLSLSSVPTTPRVSSSANGLLTAAEIEEDLCTLLQQVQAEGGQVRVEMLEVNGFTQSIAKLKPRDRDRLEQRFHASLRAASLRGGAAVGISNERFVILAEQTAPPNDLDQTLKMLGEEFGVSLKPHQETVPLSSELTPEQSVRALKVALDIFTRDGCLNAAASLKDVIASTSSKSRKICEIVDQERFELLFQPIIDLKLGGVHHYEALARLGGGDESPAESMHLAEELAIVDKFDHAVAAEAIRTLRENPDPNLRIAINVSSITFMQEGYVGWVLATLKKQGVNPHKLLVELTETAPVKDFHGARARIERLRAGGAQFCLDDVGSGSASLDYLRHLPFDYGKLDGRFLSDVVSNNRSRLMIENLVALCRGLGGEVIAEQIETEPVANLLKTAEVSYGQGWLFGRAAPLPPAAPAPAPVKLLRRSGAREQWG